MKNRQQFILLFAVILEVVNLFAGNTDPFSRINKYDLSYENLDSRRSAVLEGKNIFFSLPNDFNSYARPEFLSINYKNQTIGTGFFTLFNAQYHDQNTSRFGAIGGSVRYVSPLIEGQMTLNTYTTQRSEKQPFSDVEFERLMKDYDQPIISGLFNFRFNLPQAWIAFKTEQLRLSIGKNKLRWGPGYKGTLAVSGINYSPFYFYHFRMNFSSFATFSSFLCGYDDEREFADEIIDSSSIIVKNNGFKIASFLPRYGAGQRFDVKLGRHIQLGVYELVNFFGNSDIIRYANPLQIYFLGDDSGGDNNANICIGLDLNIIIRPFRIYGEILNDDLTPFDQSGNPNNFGFQIGTEVYTLSKIHTVGFEYVHSSRYLYTHSRALSRYTYWNSPLGWPWGNDQDYFNIHALIKPCKSVDLKVEASYGIKGDHPITNDWYADGAPDADFVPYFPEKANHILSFLMALRYKPKPWLSTELYFRPAWIEKKPVHSLHSFVLIDIPFNKSLTIIE